MRIRCHSTQGWERGCPHFFRCSSLEHLLGDKECSFLGVQLMDELGICCKTRPSKTQDESSEGQT